MKLALLTLTALISFGLNAGAQTAEQIERAQTFFDTRDQNNDGLLSKTEFVDGFIAQAREQEPNKTRLAMVLYGKKRIKSCLGIAFDRADENADTLMSIDELGEAYRRDAFGDLRDIC